MRTIGTAIALVVAACSTVLPAEYTKSDVPDPGELTVEWGCGHGFWVSDEAQTVALRFAFNGQGQPESAVDLPHPDWEVSLIEGTDLYANWCDDVIEADEPVPIEHWNLPVVAGHLSIEGEVGEPFSSSQMSMAATSLKVGLADGDLADLGDIEITNPMWGFFAG